MTNQQGAPEALRLADALDLYATGDEHQRDIEDAAAELRRLHAENERLAALQAQQPATHVQNPAEIEHVAGDVSKNGAESNMTQQPAPSGQQPFGWIKQSEIDSSKDFGGSINLWRQKYDCDVPMYLAQQPAPSAAAATKQEGEHLFELWWSEYMPEATQERAWRAWTEAPRTDGVGVAAPTPQADSVLEDAARESEYQRGYRHGYEQCDAEVRGALA